MTNRIIRTTNKKNVSKFKPHQIRDLEHLVIEMTNIIVLIKQLQPFLITLIELFGEQIIDRVQDNKSTRETIITKLDELLAIVKDTKEITGFVKMVFTQEKPKQTKVKVPKSVAINEYLRKYNKSMK